MENQVMVIEKSWQIHGKTVCKVCGNPVITMPNDPLLTCQELETLVAHKEQLDMRNATYGPPVCYDRPKK